MINTTTLNYLLNFFSFCVYYYFFLRLWTRQETLYLYIFYIYIYICIIASNDNNQCMQFVCPYCEPIDWNNKYSYSYSIHKNRIYNSTPILFPKTSLLFPQQQHNFLSSLEILSNPSVLFRLVSVSLMFKFSYWFSILQLPSLNK